MKVSIKVLLNGLFIIFCLLISVQLKGQCSATQLGSNIRFANTFSEQVGDANAISKDGTTIIVGARGGKIGSIRPGRVRIYSYNETTNSWDEKGQELFGDFNDDLFGGAVALNSDGTHAIIGALQSSGSSNNIGGYARVYNFNSTNGIWELLGQQLTGINPNDAFGKAVDISGDGQTIVVGAPANDTGGLNAGLTGVYKYNSTTQMWDTDTTVIGNTNIYQGTGTDVTISENGSRIGIASAVNARIYEHNVINNKWTQLGSDFNNGSSLDISRDGICIAIGDESANGFNGMVTIYKYFSNNSEWQMKGDTIKGDSEFRFIGRDVKLNANGNTLITGAPFYRNQPFSDREKGATLVYNLDTSINIWSQTIEPIYGNQKEEQSGYSVDISGDGLTLISGAPRNHNDLSYSHAGQAQIYRIDLMNCGSCIFATDTTFADITIPCNSKLESPKILDVCIDSMICGVPLDSGFYFMQDTFITQWQFTTSDGIMDSVLQNIIVHGVTLCDTSSMGIGSLRNALECAEEGDTIDILANLMNDTLILDGSGLTVDTDVVLSVEPGNNVVIDATGVLSAFNIETGSALTLDGIHLIVGSSADGGAAVNNGILNILNSIIFPNPTNPGGSQFSGNGEINIDPVTVIHP